MSWPTRRLGDLMVDGLLPYGIVQPGGHVDGGIPIVRVKDLRAGEVSTENPLRVAPSVSARHSRTVLSGGELLLSLVGSVGECAVVPARLEGWNVARAIAVLRPAGVSSKWLQFALQSPAIREAMFARLNTTVQATLNLADLRSLPIPVPSAAVMAGIVELIGALDERIATNNAGIAQVDSLIALHYKNQATTAPKTQLSGLASFVNGRAFTKDATGSGRVVIRIAELTSGLGPSTVRTDLDVPDQHLARPGDILFAWSGSLTVHRWFRDEAIVNQHIFKVVPNGYPVWLVKCALDWALAEFTAIAADKATTMGHIQRRHLDLAVPVPEAHAIENLDPLMSVLWRRALAAEQESLKLAELRDTLLGPLMSGSLKIKDAERVVEEVV